MGSRSSTHPVLSRVKSILWRMPGRFFDNASIPMDTNAVSGLRPCLVRLARRCRFLDRFGRSGSVGHQTGRVTRTCCLERIAFSRDRLSGCIGDCVGPVRFGPLVTTNGAPEGRIGWLLKVAEPTGVSSCQTIPSPPRGSNPPAAVLLPCHLHAHALALGLFPGTEKG
jgi:hypothetical protein